MSRRGVPLFYEVFDGSRADVTTVEEVVEAMEQRYGKAQRIGVMDRGMVSEANLGWLRQRGAQYLVGTPKGMLRKFEKPLLEKDWKEVEPGIEVKLCALADGSSADTFILCRSRARIEKEKAILERFLVRVETGLAKIPVGHQKEDRVQAHIFIGSLEIRKAALGRTRIGQLPPQSAGGIFQVEVDGRVDADRHGSSTASATDLPA